MRRVAVAGCCGYRSVRDSRSVSLSHPPGGPRSGTHPRAPSSPFRQSSLSPRHLHRYRPRTLRVLLPRANIFPFCPLQNHPAVPSLYILPLPRIRRSALEFFDTRLHFFFFFFDKILFIRNLRLSDFRIELLLEWFSFGALYIKCNSETLKFSASRAIGLCIFTLTRDYSLHKQSSFLSLWTLECFVEARVLLRFEVLLKLGLRDLFAWNENDFYIISVLSLYTRNFYWKVSCAEISRSLKLLSTLTVDQR